jgi:catechol 2,3-dioxygenase-like lactoylglutathione lyase family enzyme
MYFQSVVMNVADLDRSIAFYREVMGFALLSRQDQLAAIHAAGNERPQVIILRELGTATSRVSGARHVGMRALIVEVDSLDELERIATEMDRRHSLVTRPKGDTWIAAFGRDPDGIAVVAGCSLSPGPVTLDSWAQLDLALYGLGE